jgi:histidinol-phosphate aminotransferase
MLSPLPPTESFLKQFLVPSLMESKGYHIDAPVVGIKLDQNESPWDWPDEVKDLVLSRLRSMHWNRYPSPFADELVEKIADHLSVPSDTLLLGPGSNYLIALVLQTFSKRITGKVVLARPSFALYESQCNYEGIPYEVWPLNNDLEYDESLLPPLTPGSMVVFASPNNPVGNVLTKDRFRSLLSKYPNVLWVADEAYCEFSDEPYTPLLSEFSNFIIIRTFSKTMGAAGVRLGYILGATNVINLLKKPRVPFLINQFTLAAVTEVLSNPNMAKVFDQIVKNAIGERKRLEAALIELESKLSFKVKTAQANFLLAKWPDTNASTKAYKFLLNDGILVRNVAAAPGLAGCLRVSVGTVEQNDRLIQSFEEMF